MIFWGTFFPLISELFTGDKASLAAPWFDRYTTPLAILLVLFTGIGPLFAWRRVSLGAARRLLARPALAAVAVTALLVRVHRCRLASAGARDVRVRRVRARGAGPGVRPRRRRLPLALRAAPTRGRSPALFARNRRRYGGYVVHAGLAILLIAVAASSSFQTSRDLRLRPGQSATVDDYTITYEKPTAEIEPAEQRLTFGSVLTVTKDGKPYATLYPSRNYYSGVGGARDGRPEAADPQLLRGRGDQRGRAQDHRRRRPLDLDDPGPRRRSTR